MAVTEDLFIRSRISELAASAGVEARFPTSENEMTYALQPSIQTLVILDLSTKDYDPFTLARKAKRASQSVRVLGHYPHVRTELKTRAEAVGFDYIVPNSNLLSSLRKILSGEKA